MRHVRSVLYALVLSPAVWVLVAVGLNGDLTARGRDGFAVESITGLVLLMLAGTAYGILIFAPISPTGPTLAGLAFLGAGIWAVESPSAYAGVWPPAVVKEGFDLSRPGYGLAVLLAVPMLLTVLSTRRWQGYVPPVLPLIGQIGGARGSAPVPGTSIAISETTVLPGIRHPADPTQPIRTAEPTQVVRSAEPPRPVEATQVIRTTEPAARATDRSAVESSAAERAKEAKRAALAAELHRSAQAVDPARIARPAIAAPPSKSGTSAPASRPAPLMPPVIKGPSTVSDPPPRRESTPPGGRVAPSVGGAYAISAPGERTEAVPSTAAETTVIPLRQHGPAPSRADSQGASETRVLPLDDMAARAAASRRHPQDPQPAPQPAPQPRPTGPAQTASPEQGTPAQSTQDASAKSEAHRPTSLADVPRRQGS